MKASLFTLSFSFLFAIFSYGQITTSRWGKITSEEMEMTVYEKDKNAEAVVLCDVGESSFVISSTGGYEIHFKRRRRVKILDRAGIDYAEVTIPYYTDGFDKTERVIDIEAFSYNMADGRLIKKEVDPSDVRQEVINEKWKREKFAFPDVKEGTIIEHRYTLISPFHFNLPDWKFQDEIPTVYSQYTVSLIPFYEYVFIVQGTNKFSYQHSAPSTGLPRRFAGLEFQDMVSTYVMKDVPAFKDESYMTTIDDYIMKMDFQLAKINRTTGTEIEIITTWEDLNDELLKHEDFGKYIKKANKVAEDIIMNELNLDGLSSKEKATEVIKYVRTAFSWNNFNARYASKSVKAFYKEKTGNAADINLFLAAMLTQVGAEVTPVLISTRSHGKIRKDYPFSHYFNYVILLVKVDDYVFLADGTEKNLAYDRIPARCINDDGLLVQKEPEWLNLRASIKSMVNRNLELSIDIENASVQSKVLEQYTEYESFDVKERYNDDAEKLMESVKRRGFNEVAGLRTMNYEKPKKPYFVEYSGQAELEFINDKIIVYPFFKFPQQENRLKQKKRKYPVDFIYPYAREFNAKIKIPEGYDVEKLPEKFVIENEVADVSLEYARYEDEINVKGIYDFKKGVYMQNEYSRVKYYLDNIVKRFNAPLVLEEIELAN